MYYSSTIIKKYVYKVHNTCPFNSIDFITSMAYIDHIKYRNFIDSSNNYTWYKYFIIQIAVTNTSDCIFVKKLHRNN